MMNYYNPYYKVKNILLLLLILLHFLASAQGYRPQFSTAGFYQTDSSVRKAINFNIGWRFIKKNIDGAEKMNFNDSDWEIVNLPHGLELLPLCASGGMNYQGIAWYRKRFVLNSFDKRKKIMIHFEGIMGKSKIWVNGKLVKKHFGGYFPIHIDVTDYIHFGKENIIAVMADNSNDDSYPPGKPKEKLDFTYFGGMYRDAWLIMHNDLYVSNSLAVDKVAGGGVFVHYDNLSEKSVDILIDIDVENEGKKRKVDCILDLFYLDMKKGGVDKKNIEISSKSSSQISFKITIDDPKLWYPDSPHLYDLFISIKDQNGKILDAFKKRIGIRSIEMKGQNGLILNGKSFKQKLIGGNRHQDFAHIGNALPNNLHYRDALKLRRAGMRVIRSAHYVQDPAFMDACDELGLFVIATIPGWQFWNKKDSIFEKRMLSDVRNLVRLERNRPSILLWEVVPNETHYPDDFALKSTKATKEEYPYQGNYTACDARAHRSKAQKYFDVLYSNDIDSNFKEKSIFKREWGDFVDNWVDHNSVSRVAKQWGELPQIKQAMHYFKEEWVDNGVEQDWPSLTKIYKASNSLIGATMWHPFDHQRGYHPDPFWGGIMDAYRQPKFSYYLLKSLMPSLGLENVPNVDAEPFVFIAHLMTPFSPEDVVVFTNCDEVRLYAYDKEIGTMKSTSSASPVPRIPVVFKNIYRYVDARNKNKKDYGKINQKYNKNATLRAEGIIKGEVVAEHVRWPVGRKHRIMLKVDHSGVDPLADGSDITPVVAYLVDAGGAVKRLSDEYIRFTVTGEGELIEDNKSTINPQRLLWGEAVALVRSTKKPGQVKVRAELINDGINLPDFGEIEFTTVSPEYDFSFAEYPQKQESQILINDSQIDYTTFKKMEIELKKTKKELQKYELNKVGEQQQKFIE